MFARAVDEQRPLRTFSPLTKWDFFLSVDDDQQRGLFIPQSQLPEEWFYEKTALGGEHTWRPPRASRRLHYIAWKKDDWPDRAQSMIRVLDHYLATSGISCSIDRPFRSALVKGDHSVVSLEHDTSTITDSFDLPRTAESSRKKKRLRGEGRLWSPKRFEATQEFLIRQLCQEE